MRSRLCSLCILLVAGGAHGKAGADNPAFMMVGGISGPAEMCLAAANGNVGTEGAAVALEPCAAAVAAGDGRELWRHLPNGQIASAVGDKCIGTSGDAVVLAACDGAGAWEAQGNGQLKLGGAGQNCLSQEGAAVGVEDVAARGAITASSSADAAAHGAGMAVDGSSSTFWASALNPSGPVTITADLGAEKQLSEVSVDWEFPAKAFTVSVSTDGVKWSEVYSTDSNILSTSSISLGAMPATKVRLVMREASESFQGHPVYGIRTLAVLAPRLRSILEDCAIAAKSGDARDKYFETHIGGAPGASKALRSELPSLEAARASVATVVSELSQVLPKISSCRGAARLIRTEGSSSVFGQGGLRTGGGNALSQVARDVDRQNGIDTEGVGALVKEARRVIIAARSALD